MRLRRTHRRNLTLLSTRYVQTSGFRPVAGLARRRRFRFMRTGFLLAVVGVLRLARFARYRWRLSLGLVGVLLEVLGHLVLPGPARGGAYVLGLLIMLVAFLKSEDPALRRRAAVPQAAWRWRG